MPRDDAYDELARATFAWWRSHTEAGPPLPPEIPAAGPARARWPIATHEASHACVGILVGLPLRAVFAHDPAGPGDLAVPDLNAGAVLPLGSYRTLPFNAAVTFLLSGYAGQRRVHPLLPEDPEVETSNDYRQAREAIAARRHLDPWCPRVTAELRRLERVAERVVDAHWPWIERVARELVTRGRMTGPEVEALRPTSRR